MKSRSEIWYALLTEVGNACSVSTVRDVKYITHRVAKEGESLFTITLPRFEKDLTRSLSLGSIPTDAFEGFARRQFIAKDVDSHERVRGIPELFGGFLDLLFTSEKGFVDEAGRHQTEWFPVPFLRKVDPLDVESIERFAMTVKGLRQLLLLFSKEKALCDQSKIDQAVQEYINIDAQMDLPLTTRGQVLSLRINCLSASEV